MSDAAPFPDNAWLTYREATQRWGLQMRKDQTEYIRKDASDAAIAAARAEGVREGMLKAADRLGSMAAQTPLGNESRERGSSTYNWLRYCEKWVRNFAAEAQP